MKASTLISFLTAMVLMVLATFASAIELSFRFNDPEAREMRAALDQFEQENPGIKVELQTIAWGQSRAQFLREAAVGEGPDVVHIAFVWPRDMGSAGALHPLNEFIKGFTAFSEIPLYLSLIFGISVATGAFGLLIFILIYKFLGLSLPGWAAIMTVLLLLGGMTLITNGVIGIYIGRVFNNIKGSPAYIISSTTGFNGETKEQKPPTPPLNEI